MEPRLLLARLAGTVFADLDRDGRIDPGDPAQSNRTVFIDENRDGVFQPVVASRTHSSQDVPKPINDFRTTVSTLTIDGFSGSVTDVDLAFHLTHTFDADLFAVLVSPQGVRVRLFDGVGRSGENFGTSVVSTVLDDEARIDLEDGEAPFAGRYRPLDPLSRFDGASPNGVWRLEITDDASDDIGLLRSWSLVVSTGEPSAISSFNGVYSFTNLAAGEYQVRQVLLDAWQETFPAAGVHTVTLSATENRSDLHFGSFFTLGSIGGQAFGDINGNGQRDPGEFGLSDWTIYLDADRDGRLDLEETSVQTDLFGNFRFGNLPAGEYLVRVLVRDGWEVTAPAAEAFSVTLSVGQNVASLRFGNFPLPAEINGRIWNDRNGDGVRDLGEPALPNWVVFLDVDESGDFSLGDRTTTSDRDGFYRFEGLAAGNYSVGLAPRPGWQLTHPGLGPEGGVVPPGRTAPVGEESGLSANWSDAMSASLARAADLSQYSKEDLASVDRWVLFLDPAANVESVRQSLGLLSLTGSDLIANSWIATFPLKLALDELLLRLAFEPAVLNSYPLLEKLQPARLVPNDPLFAAQWHLRNTEQSGGRAGADVNVSEVWNRYLGSGSVIGIVDDGLEGTHPDLAANYVADLSRDFNGNDLDPSPEAGDFHGTAVAGVAAARGDNRLGVSGVAPRASLAGLRLIAGPTDDAQIAEALTYRSANIDIYSNSWGPFDDATRFEGPGPLTLAALDNAARTGRNGLGNIYLWAAGNGLTSNDNSNYDGFSNSRFAIAVSAIDHDGIQSYYSEPGANILVAGYSNSFASGIVTTDRVGPEGYGGIAGQPDYTDEFGGTSSATPLVAGVVALMLEANPSLTWRDVQHILARSARKNDPGDASWSTNGAGLRVSHKYGFGAVDAAAAVALAENWNNVAPEISATSGRVLVNQSIPDNSVAGRASRVMIDAAITVEHVEVAFEATHSARGNLRIVLTSPSGAKSELAVPHADTNDNLNWVFSSVHHWGENSFGEWTLTVTDETTGAVGEWESWKLNVYGASANRTLHYAALDPGEIAGERDFGVVNVTAPMVTGVALASGRWAPSFVHYLDVHQPSNTVSPGIGWAVAGGAAQASVVPYSNIDRLSIRFSEPTNVLPADLLLVGSTDGPALPAISGFRYDAANFVATWHFAAPLPSNHYLVRLTDRVADADGNRLDGEWQDAASQFPSGNGQSGGEFHFRFRLVAGDVDGSGEVTLSDADAIRRAVGQSTMSAGYDPRLDVDGSGGITYSEAGHTRLGVGFRLSTLRPPETAAVANRAELIIPLARQMNRRFGAEASALPILESTAGLNFANRGSGVIKSDDALSGAREAWFATLGKEEENDWGKATWNRSFGGARK